MLLMFYRHAMFLKLQAGHRDNYRKKVLWKDRLSIEELAWKRKRSEIANQIKQSVS